jgi:hypothetical protein
MSEEQVPVRWQADGFEVSIPLPQEEYLLLGAEFVVRMPSPEIAQLVAAAPELRDTLGTVLGWLEGSDVFATSHGAHSDAVEARKLVDRLSEA